MNTQYKSSIISIFILVTLAAFTRLLPHPANFTPIAAMSLLGGAYIYNKKMAILIPILAMFVSDVILQALFLMGYREFAGFHALMPVVYFCMAITSLLGFWVQKNITIKRTFLAVIASSTLFFIVTNFAVWYLNSGTFYPKTLNGLLLCYQMAMPFFRNSILGDMFFAAILFSIYQYISQKSKILAKLN